MNLYQKEKYMEYLELAGKSLRTADHMAYVTYPLLKEKMILFEILNNVYSSILNIINAVLQYDYLYKRINLYKDAETNLQTFREKCAPRYSINREEIGKIGEIMEIMGRHKNSQMEFMRKDKLVIMGENMHTETLTLEKIREFVFIAKIIQKKTEEKIRGRKFL